MLVHGKKMQMGGGTNIKMVDILQIEKLKLMVISTISIDQDIWLGVGKKLVNTGNIIIQKHIMDVQKDLCENLHGLETIM